MGMKNELRRIFKRPATLKSQAGKAGYPFVASRRAHTRPIGHFPHARMQHLRSCGSTPVSRA